jgi:hypothetical protein
MQELVQKDYGVSMMALSASIMLQAIFSGSI